MRKCRTIAVRPEPWWAPVALVAAVLGLLAGAAQAQDIALPQQDEGLFSASCRPSRRLLGYDLTPALLNGTTARTEDFRPDLDIPAAERAELRDYAGSGFDRGHMAPAETFKRSRPAMSQSFLLSNMAPQTAKLNRGRWQRLEHEVRALARSGERTVVITGSLFLDRAAAPTLPSRTIGGPTASRRSCSRRATVG